MWAEKTNSGKFKFKERYTALDGSTKTVSVTLDRNNAQTRKQALQILSERIDKASDTVSDLTFGELVELYLDAKEPVVKSSTLLQCARTLTRIGRFVGNNTKVDNLTPKRLKACIMQNTTSKQASNTYLRHLRTLLKWAYKEEYMDNNLADRLPNFPIRKTEDITEKFLEADELRKLLDGFKDPYYREITRFLALSGLRIGELIALTDEDVNLTEKTISVTKTYHIGLKESSDSPKSKTSNREVFIQPELEACIINIQRMTMERKLKYGIRCDQFVVSNRTDHLSYDTYYAVLVRTSMKTLGRKIHPHTLRHTHASLLFEQGLPLETIQRRLGHEDCDITKQIYLHVTEKIKKRDDDMLRQIRII